VNAAEQRLRALIETQGAVAISSYMALANSHYYATRDPLGAAGDFVTAPEISQMFGELIGLWLAETWMRAGQPAPVLVELGPGRGSLMADLRRAIARVPVLGAAPVHLVETSPALRQAQKQRLPDAQWHDDLNSLPTDQPLLVVANEFFDALPICQFIRTEQGWRERMIALQDDAFTPVAGPVQMDGAIDDALAGSPSGTIVEKSPAGSAVMTDLAARIAAQGGVALIIDYGYCGPAAGDTLQAVKQHQYADVLARPGEHDLTAHVDFNMLADAARQAGATPWPVTDQGEWLHRLGIAARAARLAKANPDHAQALAKDVKRLTAPDEMGSLFKVLAVTAPQWPRPIGFE